jgi:dTMP kinase
VELQSEKCKVKSEKCKLKCVEMLAERMHAHPGLFLVFDGPDGGGKSTQALRLKTWLEDRKFDVVACRDPGGTPLGDRLRRILLDRETVPISMRAEMLLYMASRAQLVEAVIAPALSAGQIVISDRYLLANIVYQGTAGGLLEEEIAMVGMIATAGLLPDLTIVLDIAPEQALARLGTARDRIEDRPLFYHERVRGGFLAAARGESGASGEGAESASVYPAPIVLIDASADQDTVFKRIQHEVERALSRRG